MSKKNIWKNGWKQIRMAAYSESILKTEWFICKTHELLRNFSITLISFGKYVINKSWKVCWQVGNSFQNFWSVYSIFFLQFDQFLQHFTSILRFLVNFFGSSFSGLERISIATPLPPAANGVEIGRSRNFKSFWKPSLGFIAPFSNFSFRK